VKILYVSQYFPPEMGAPSARVHELSREWVRRGNDVTVLTGFPHHPTGVVPEGYRGELFRREEVDGIHVVRAPIYVAANKGRVRRSLSYLSFSASASAVGPFLGRPEVIVATSPQLLSGLAGLWLSAVRRVPFLFEVRDLWPRSIVEVGALAKDSLAVRGLEKLELLLYRRADRIVAVTESFVDEIAALGIDRGKLRVVTNGVDLELFAPADRLEARRALGLPEEGFLATYVGTHGLAHGLSTLLEVAARLPAVRFLLVGEGAEKAALKARAQANGLANVLFWDQRDRCEVARILAASDVALVLLRNQPLFRTVIPSKIFECMGAARPILSTVDGESRRILDSAGAGVFSNPEDPESLAAALDSLRLDPARLQSLGLSGRRWVEQHYSRPALAARYEAILQELLREQVR
jgi:glycosyltransferase involved in cell wall biosynthesis